MSLIRIRKSNNDVLDPHVLWLLRRCACIKSRRQVSAPNPHLVRRKIGHDIAAHEPSCAHKPGRAGIDTFLDPGMMMCCNERNDIAETNGSLRATT